MNKNRIRRFRRSKGAEINMAPLIDMIFILLIFFIVTTSFIKESGVDIQRPSAQTAASKEKIHIIVEVSQDGNLFIEGLAVDIRAIRPRMKRFIVETPGGMVLIVADKQSQTGTVIQVLDECRLAGVENVSIAAQKPGG
jgi:biopolymer transport protein ExbD